LAARESRQRYQCFSDEPTPDSTKTPTYEAPLGSSHISEGQQFKIASVFTGLLVTVQIVMKLEGTLNVYEAAREINCTSQWIRVLLAEQRLAGAQKIEGQWRIPAAALEKFKQREAVTTIPQ
jgi:hypothetical protein